MQLHFRPMVEVFTVEQSIGIAKYPIVECFGARVLWQIEGQPNKRNGESLLNSRKVYPIGIPST